jgi:hypothetical protein
MGTLYKGTCYPSLAVARREFCGESREAVTSGGSLVSHVCAQPVDYAASTVSMASFANGVASGTYSASWPPDLPCDHDGMASANVEWFGIVVSFLVVVWAGSRLHRFFWPKNHDL